LLSASLFVFATALRAQIVNIESARMQSDTTGWKGSASVGFTMTQNTSKVYDFTSGAHIQYKNRKNLYLLLGNTELLKNNQSSLINNSFIHFRYNHKFTSHMRWEWFAQLQNNAVTGIEFRFLAGTGPRFKLSESAKFRSYLGLSAMYEYERDKAAVLGEPSIHHRDARGNVYYSLSWKPDTGTELISTFFFQPLFTDISDFRVLEQMSLRIKPGKHFVARFDLQYLFDQQPAPGQPKVNYRFGTGIGYDF
jgi:Protein of unknown function, DUF481